jgi:hypothetical protein
MNKNDANLQWNVPLILSTQKGIVTRLSVPMISDVFSGRSLTQVTLWELFESDFFLFFATCFGCIVQFSLYPLKRIITMSVEIGAQVWNRFFRFDRGISNIYEEIILIGA